MREPASRLQPKSQPLPTLGQWSAVSPVLTQSHRGSHLRRGRAGPATNMASPHRLLVAPAGICNTQPSDVGAPKTELARSAHGSPTSCARQLERLPPAPMSQGRESAALEASIRKLTLQRPSAQIGMIQDTSALPLSKGDMHTRGEYTAWRAPCPLQRGWRGARLLRCATRSHGYVDCNETCIPCLVQLRNTGTHAGTTTLERRRRGLGVSVQMFDVPHRFRRTAEMSFNVGGDEANMGSHPSEAQGPEGVQHTMPKSRSRKRCRNRRRNPSQPQTHARTTAQADQSLNTGATT